MRTDRFGISSPTSHGQDANLPRSCYNELESSTFQLLEVIGMLAEMKAKSQVTIPSSVVKEMGLERGDMFEVYAEDGIIKFVPVVVYPKAEAEKLEALAAEARASKGVVYDDIDDALAALHRAME